MSTFFHATKSKITPQLLLISQTTPRRKSTTTAPRRLLKLLSPSNPTLAAALSALRSSTLTSTNAAALISAVSNPLLSFDFYRFLKSSPHFSPETPLFASLLRSQLLSLNPHNHRIRFYLSEIKKLGLRLSPEEFRTIFEALLPERLDLARTFVEQVADMVGLESAVCAEAVGACVRVGLVEDAIWFAEKGRKEVKGHGLEFYSSLMELCDVTGDGRLAMEVFEEMGERGVRVDERVYGVLLGILCRVGWGKLGFCVLQEMVRAEGGFKLKPDERLGLELLRVFVRHNMILEVNFLVSEGIVKEEESLVVFVGLMVEKRMSWEAFRMLKEVFDLELCAALVIRECGRQALVEEAERIFREFKSLVGNAIGYSSLYSSMISVYSKVRMRGPAEVLWGKLEASGHFSGEACLSMMVMYQEMRMFGCVVELFDKWKRSGVPVSVDGYELFVDGLINSGLLDKARDCLLEMRSYGLNIPTSGMHLSILEGFLKVGLVDDAIVLFHEYEMLGLKVENDAGAGRLARILIQIDSKKNIKPS